MDIMWFDFSYPASRGEDWRAAEQIIPPSGLISDTGRTLVWEAGFTMKCTGYPYGVNLVVRVAEADIE